MAEQTKPVLQKPPGYRDPSHQANIRPKPPVRKPVLPPSLQPRKKRRACYGRRCCCWFACVFVLVLLIIAATAALLYIYYEPTLPVFHLQSLQFPRFNITSTPDGPVLNSQAVVRIELRNPNVALKVNYDKTEVSLNAGNVDLGTATLPEFTQGKKNTTVLKLKTEVKNELLQNGVAKKLKDEFRSKSLVVRMEVRTGIGMGANRWETVKPAVKVVCGGLSLKEVEGGAVPKCKIILFGWINLPT
ncbi:hypothetical protein U1Q18_003578 [Sarracenia purpurea var. burkii]